MGRTLLSAAVALALAAGLGGCGKRGALEAPPGRESEFKYPRSYPQSRKSAVAAPAAKGDPAAKTDKEKQESQ